MARKFNLPSISALLSSRSPQNATAVAEGPSLNPMQRFSFTRPTTGRQTGFLAGIGALIHMMQEARMNQVLQSMSDSQLKSIGVKRSDIATYAKKQLV